MYGINLLVVAKILGANLAGNVLFNKHGAIPTIYQEIVKYSAQQNIAMVKVMMRTLAQQNEQAYKDVVQTLREHFSEEELQDILPQ
jgi:DNA-binding TFAR19-related protein (PDSD5 family)